MDKNYALRTASIEGDIDKLRQASRSGADLDEIIKRRMDSAFADFLDDDFDFSNAASLLSDARARGHSDIVSKLDVAEVKQTEVESQAKAEAEQQIGLSDLLNDLELTDFAGFFADVLGIGNVRHFEYLEGEDWAQARKKLGAGRFNMLKETLNKMGIMFRGGKEQEPLPSLSIVFVCWAFLSHFKVEAGSCARFIKEKFQINLISKGFEVSTSTETPTVFLDSDNLPNLSILTDFVRRSENFVFLLTKGILGRPWCIVELIAAVDAAKNIVLVELNYRSPERFDLGSVAAYVTDYPNAPEVDSKCVDFLTHMGITVEKVQQTIAVVFNIMAKSLNASSGAESVINAELAEIMKVMRFESLTRQKA